MTIDFWFDPACPFTWVTSRFVVDVAQQTNQDVHWHPFSLAFLNEGNEGYDESNSHYFGHHQGLRAGRVGLAAYNAAGGADGEGSNALGRFYTALGTAMYVDGKAQDLTPETMIDLISDALATAGLDPALIEHADNTSGDDALRASTEAAISLTGKGVGIPIIKAGEQAFFGPVFSKAPTGAAALKFWEAYLTLTAEPHFFELKRQFRGPLDFA